MNRRSRLATLIGTVCFVGLALWWSVWFPFAPDRVRRAIPPHATLVGEHYDLRRDVQSLLRNPSLRQSIHVLGGDAEAIDSYMASRYAQWLGLCLGGRYTVTAYAPPSASARESSWMLASWGGVRAQLMRWMLDAGMMAGWERLPGRSPVRAYRYTQGDGTGTLAAAIYEGVILVCYSRDPAVVKRAVRRLTYGQPASVLPDQEQMLSADRVQVCWWPGRSDAPRSEFALTSPVTNRVALSAMCASRMALPMLKPPAFVGQGWTVVPGAVLPAVSRPESRPMAHEAWERVSRGLGSLSGALVVAPSAVLDQVLADGGAPAFKVLYNRSIRPRLAEDGVVALALLHDQYSGRLLGIKTPSLVMALKVQANLDLAKDLSVMLDEWNAQLGLSLMGRQREAEADGARLFLIDEARNGIYASMKRAEKPVLWQSGDWLFVASNMAAAREVRRALKASVPPPQATWWQTAEAQPDAMHAWCDFEAAGSAVRKLVALYAIVQMAQGQRGGSAVMERTGNVVSALEPFGEGCMDVSAGPDVWTARVTLGR